MPFDIAKFNAAEFKPRERAVPVPTLREFFKDEPEDKQPEWIVRGLTGDEIARVSVQVKMNRAVNAEAIASQTDDKPGLAKAIIQGIMSAFSASGVEDDTVQRMNLLHIGSVNPEIDYPTAIRIAEHFPVDFFNLTNVILELSQMGAKSGE